MKNGRKWLVRIFEDLGDYKKRLIDEKVFDIVCDDLWLFADKYLSQNKNYSFTMEVIKQ